MPAVQLTPGWRRLVDLTVYAPIGVAATLRENLPRFVSEGRQVVEQRITVARWIGQMAVQQGRRQVEQHLAAMREQAATSARADAVEPDAVEPVDVDEPPALGAPLELEPAPDAGSPDLLGAPTADAVTDVSDLAAPDLAGPDLAGVDLAAPDLAGPDLGGADPAGGGPTIDLDAVPTAAELPIEGYESLAAMHVVQRLSSLDPSELELVRRFEVAGRARRTVLGKIAQLQGE